MRIIILLIISFLANPKAQAFSSKTAEIGIDLNQEGTPPFTFNAKNSVPVSEKSRKVSVLYLKKKVKDKNYTLKLWITTNPLCLGSDSDCKIARPCLKDAVAITRKLGAVLPTKGLLTEINKKLKKDVLGPAPFPKNHLFITKETKPPKVCPESSSGLRLISNQIEINGKINEYKAILKDPELSALISDQGPIDFDKLYPTEQ